MKWNKMKITREDGTSVGFEKQHALHKIAVREMTSFIRKFEVTLARP